MADVSKSVEILFTGNDKLSDKMGAIRGGFNSLDDSITSLSGPLADLASGVLTVEAALSALATGALVYSVDKAIKFQNATIELDKVLSEEEGLAGSLDAASKKAIEFSDKYGESSTDILSSMANFKQAGFEVDESMQLVGNSMDLVIAGELEAAESSELLVAQLKGFKAPAEEAGRLVDILNAVSNEYATNVKELATGMADLSPVANQMGLNFEETAGVLTPVIEVFGSGSEAANALKTGLLKLIDDTAPVQDALASIGVAQRDANGELRSGKDILYDVMGAFGGLTQSQKLFVTQQLVGVEQSARMVEVFDQGNKVMAVTETALKSAGSAAAEVAKRLESAEVQVDRFGASFENLAIAVGTKFLDATASAAGGATDLNKAIREAVEEGSFDPLFQVLDNIGIRIGGKFKEIAEAMPEALADVDWTKLTNSIKNLTGEIGDSFDALFGDLDLSKPEDLTKLIQRIIDGIAGLTNVTAGIVDSWQPFLKMIGEAVDQFIDLDDGTQKTAGNVLGFGQVADKVIGPLKSVLSAVDNIGVSLGVMAASSAAGTISKIGSSATEAGGLLNTFGGILNQSIGSATAGQTLGVMGLGYAVGYAAGKLLEEFVPGVKEGSQAVADWLVDILHLGAGQDDINESLQTTAENLDHMRGKFGEIGKELDDLSSKELIDFKVEIEESGLTIEDINKAFTALPEEKQIEVVALIEQGKIDEAIESLSLIPEEKSVSIDAYNVDEVSDQMRALGLTIESDIPDEKLVAMGFDVDESGIDQTKDALAGVPAEKTTELVAKADRESIQKAKEEMQKLELEKLEIQAKIDVANIEAEAEKVKAAFESMSEIGVASIEANAEKYVAALESISNTATGTMDLLGDLFSLWGGETSLSKQFQIEEWIDEQLQIQREQLDLQKSLVEEQIKWYRAKTDALSSGDALIKIESDGLEPELEAFMWKIVEKVQMRVAEEYSEYLLGLNPAGV